MNQEVYEILKNRIITGEYASGDKLNKLDIAKEFKISLPEVQTILDQLVEDQYILQFQTEGYIVIEISIAESKEYLDVRQGLEIKALQDLARDINSVRAEELKHLSAGIYESWKRKDFHRFTYNVKTWREKYLDLITNKTLKSYLQSIQNKLSRVENHLLNNEEYQILLIKYIKSINTILAENNPEKVADMIKAYISSVKELLENIEKDGTFRY